MPMLSRRVQQAAFRLADRQNDRLADQPQPGHFGDIVAVAVGAGTDGNSVVTVNWNGEDCVAAGYAASYTPVVGHRVAFLVIHDQPWIVDRSVGHPA